MNKHEITTDLNLAELGAHRSYNFEWYCKAISNHSLASLRINRTWGSFQNKGDDGVWEVEIRSTSSAYNLEGSEAVMECLVQAQTAARGIDFEKVEVKFQAAEIIRREREEIRRAEETAKKAEAEAADPAFGEDRVKDELGFAIKAFREHTEVKAVLITRRVRCGDKVELYRLDFARHGGVAVSEIEVRDYSNGKWIRTIQEDMSQRDLKEMLARSSHLSIVKCFASHDALTEFLTK